jgi:hypothetical protein
MKIDSKCSCGAEFHGEAETHWITDHFDTHQVDLLQESYDKWLEVLYTLQVN